MNIIKFNNSILKYSGKWLETNGTPTPVDPYNPLNLPPNVVRVRTSDGNAPVRGANSYYDTATLVTGTTDVYDVYESGTNFSYFLGGATNVIEVLGANTKGIVNMQHMFTRCSSLTSVPLFDTSSVTTMQSMFSLCTSLTTVPLFDTSNVNTRMESMFEGCTSLVTVPLFDTSKVTDMDYMFKDCSSLTSVPLFNTSNVLYMACMFESCTSLTTIPLFNTSSVSSTQSMFIGCINVESGALALYNQMSTQTKPPTDHYRTFHNCGSNTTAGAAELAQIPSDWK